MPSVADEFHVYLIGQKFVGQKCRNFSLVSKILSDETFFPSKILFNISIQKSGKIRTKLSKFRFGVEILSDEIFCPTEILSEEFLSDKVRPICFIRELLCS